MVIQIDWFLSFDGSNYQIKTFELMYFFCLENDVIHWNYFKSKTDLLSIEIYKTEPADEAEDDEDELLLSLWIWRRW